MNDWPHIARTCIARGERCALLTVTRTEGSTPREVGARMLICGEAQHGTIGGGKLELDATERARALLTAPADAGPTVIKVYNLGASLGQCCGGTVEVSIQRLDEASLPHLDRLLAPEQGLPVVLFGAGHVGRALVHVLSPLGWPMTWVETRDDALPTDRPCNVDAIATDIPVACVDDAAPGSAFVIMTHDHALDYELCERVLKRGDFAYCGLIGSRTKRAKFAHRLEARGIPADQVARIVCPIGERGLGKAPFEVAIAAAAQLLRVNKERTR